ncbi:MAG TPA: helix-turn-helix transcriptional regulator [Actinomycetota bacterium]|nr:helix-turn-helix transcriptional regulator [Actinomycetota bacterium]
MKVATVGWEVARQRNRAGLTQAELASRMGTTQSAVSKIESGRVIPTLPWLERFARAIDRPFDLRIQPSKAPSRAMKRARVRQVLGEYRFNPWARDPSPAEARTLLADGLTRERFERSHAAPAGKR